MNTIQRPDVRPQAAAVPDAEDLGFVLDDDEIDLDLPDWPAPATDERVADTSVPLPLHDTAPSGPHSVRAADLGPLGKGLDDDFDLPLPDHGLPLTDSAAEAKSRSSRVTAAGARARDTDSPSVSPGEFDVDFDLDIPAPQAADESAARSSAERSGAQRPAAKPGSKTAATKPAPTKDASAKLASEPGAGARAHAASKPSARTATPSASGGRPAGKVTSAGQSALGRTAPAAASSGPAPTAAPAPSAVAAAPDLPDDPGYDVLPAGALPGALPGTQAERPGTPAGLKPRRRLRRWMAAVAGVVLIGGLAYLGLTVFGGDGASREPGAYELVRARALNRARTNPPVTEAKLGPDSPSAAAVPATANPQASPPAAASARSPVEIGIAYGTEKRNWLEWAAQEFAASNAGQHVRVQLIPMGSLESAHAILDGDPRIHVWSPASSLARETLLRDWEAKYQGSPILKEEPLALTPMVLVMWKSRYEAFTAKCPNVSLRTFNYAMRAEGGWATIAGRPAWGRFKFGHTHPNQSNSGLMTLIMLACEFFGKKTGLTVSEIMSPSFQDYLTEFRAGVAGVSHSTGTLMKEMTLKGPTCYDALLVYENLAIEYAESAEGRWDSLQVIYPEHNLWNENPYVILNTPWTTPEHQQAAEEFLAFLLSEPVQTRALDFGFRPANPRVPVKGPNSPFAKYAKYGLAVELPATCDVPSREVMENLQQSWIRCAPARPDGPR